jgi:hypothetical protein
MSGKPSKKQFSIHTELTAVTVLITFVTPLYSVLVDTEVTVVTRSTVTNIVIGAPVVQAVTVCHLVVCGSVIVTVLLSRPRFSIMAGFAARRAERAARKAARSSRAACRRAASRRRGRVVDVDVGVGLGVSKAAAWTMVGVMVHVGSW